ncbi:MAG: P-loop NTPase [Candidatus Hydrogenedentes bacterium]|nr:P-loop NTPase [Candidatus Hydrogenedentota bacterium]
MEEQFSRKALERFKDPRNYEELEEPDGHARITGPCGDTMEFWIQVEEGIVTAASFTTTGCGPSRACGSMATELAEGKTVREAGRIEQKDILEALDGMPEEHQHCALLASNTLKAAVADFMARQAARGNPPQEGDSACSSCDKDSCSARNKGENESLEDFLERQALEARLCHIGHKILVLSGKGGVGKSTVAVNIAVSLMMAGKRVGLLDVDIHGPSIPKMLGLEGSAVENNEGNIVPVELGTLKVISLGFFLRNEDDAVIWRGPMKMGVIKQFLKDVEWGDLDYLVVDSPPGTGDEPLSVCQLLPNADGAVVVTTPQDVSVSDVRKSITFCRQLNMPVLGVVENMSGFVCPHCGEITEIFKTGGGARMANQMGVPFLGGIPLDPGVANACDAGRPYTHHFPDTPAGLAFKKIIDPILALDK